MAQPPSSVGSSPRARGTHRPKALAMAAARFIPAGAGNATRHASRELPKPVHPRGRGERVPPWRRSRNLIGSSPRARGTLRDPGRAHSHRRFIPAGAGNAPNGRFQDQRFSVHPRGRGERIGLFLNRFDVFGSSPRARGTLLDVLLGELVARFIPAGAGNAWSPPCRTCRSTVHPRGRGERA